MILPVSCAISSAGITTLIAMWLLQNPIFLDARAGLDHFAHMLAGAGIGLANRRQSPAGGEVLLARDQQLVGREAGDDFVTGFGYDDFFFDTGGAPAVFRGPEGFESE